MKILFPMLACLSALAANAAVMTYPEYPAAIPRDYAYAVSVVQGDERRPVVVYNRTEKSVLLGRTRGGDVNRRFCEFAFDGGKARVDIRVTEDVKSYDVFPARLGLRHSFKDGVISVELERPANFGIRLNDYDKSILSVFADRPEDPASVPERNAPGVLYVDGWLDAPGRDGVLETGKDVKEIYIAPGAVLNARLIVRGKGALVHGRGMVLDPLSDIFRFDQTKNVKRGLLVVGAPDVTVRDVKLVDARTFNFMSWQPGVRFENVKAMAAMMCSDGFTIGGRGFVCDGAWLYVGDNALVVSGEDMTISNAVLGTSCAAIFPQGSPAGRLVNVDVFRADDGLINNRYNGVLRRNNKWSEMNAGEQKREPGPQDLKHQTIDLAFEHLSAVDCVSYGHFFSGRNMGTLRKAFSFADVSLPPAARAKRNVEIDVRNDLRKWLVTSNYEFAVSGLWLDGSRAKAFDPATVKAGGLLSLAYADDPSVPHTVAEKPLRAEPEWTCPDKVFCGEALVRDWRLALTNGVRRLAPPAPGENLVAEKWMRQSVWQRVPSWLTKLETENGTDPEKRVYALVQCEKGAGMQAIVTEGALAAGAGRYRLSFEAAVECPAADGPVALTCKVVSNDWKLEQQAKVGKDWTKVSVEYDLPIELPRDDLVSVGISATRPTDRIRIRSIAFEKVSGGFAIAERGGAADCTIVLPASPTAVQKYAAEELRDFTERLTGVKLPIVAGSCPASGRAVVFEDGGAENPAEDGFRIRVDGGRLTVTASPFRGGPLYAVYELLERFGGCRWYASWCERVPERNRFTVPAPLDETHVPAFAMRQPWWYDALRHHAFAARLRMNTHQWGRMEDKFGGEHFRYGGGLGSCHTFAALLPVEKYGKEHPEYFALRNGKRCNEANGHVQYYVQPCLTNPDVLRIMTEGVLERIRKDPKAKFYGVSQNDNWHYCQCERCAAVDAEEDSHAGTVVRFVNAVAERVEKEFPDAVIETLAYQFSRKPPKKTRLRKNVIPCLCSIECDFARPIPASPNRQNVDFLSDIRGWSAMTDMLYVWDYTTDFANYTMPFPNVLALQDNVRFFRDSGVKCLFEQGAYQGRHADFAELKAWLLSKWMWDPELPMEDLLDDFFTGYYGAGAPYVREYFDELHRLQLARSADPQKPLTIFLGCNAIAGSDGFFEQAAGLLEKAAAAVKDDAVRSYNVRMASFAVDYMRLQRKRGTAAPLVVMDPAWEKSEELMLARQLAELLLARMDEAKDIRLCENLDTHKKRVEEWRDLLVRKPRFALEGRAEVEEADLSQAKRGIWGEFVDDPQAADGKALKLFNTHYEWCTTFPMSKVAFRPGVKYTVRVRVRVEPCAGLKGEAFWAGVYDPKGKKACGPGIAPKVTEVKDGYRWYDVVTWEPKATDYFWIGPGRFNKKTNEQSSINSLFIDKIEFVADKPVSSCKVR